MPYRGADGKLHFKIVYWGPTGGGKVEAINWLFKKELQIREDPTGRTYSHEFGVESAKNVRIHVLTTTSHISAIHGVIDGVIFMWDARLDRWDENVASLEELLTHLSDSNALGDTIPIIIMSNNQDLPDIVRRKQILAFLKTKGLGRVISPLTDDKLEIQIYDTIAKQGLNIKRAFQQLLRDAVLAYYNKIKAEPSTKPEIERKVERERRKEVKPEIAESTLGKRRVELLLFISYATKDSKKFRISEIAERLTSYPEIADALYWEEDLSDDIIKYMNENLGRCDVFILFCSQDALNSDPVFWEWSAAFKMKKKIIPIFEDEKQIPPLLTTRLGVRFKPKNFSGTVQEIHELILKKAETITTQLISEPPEFEEGIKEKRSILKLLNKNELKQICKKNLQEIRDRTGKKKVLTLNLDDMIEILLETGIIKEKILNSLTIFTIRRICSGMGIPIQSKEGNEFGIDFLRKKILECCNKSRYNDIPLSGK